jgi:hypothetical protein
MDCSTADCSTTKWLESEFQNVSFGDGRLNKRFFHVATKMAQSLKSCISSTFATWGEVKGAYRFFSNPKVTEESITMPHIENTLERVSQHKRIFLLQDTTFCDFKDRHKTEGLDCTHRSGSGKTSYGLLLHNSLALSEKGVPLGLIDQRFIDRKSFKAKSHKEMLKLDHWKQPLEQKESRRWLDIIKKWHNFDLKGVEAIHIADREGDIYEVFRDAVDLNEPVVIRASVNRAINKTKRRSPSVEYLFDKLQALEPAGIHTISIQVNGKKKFRNAQLEVSYTSITIPAPLHKTKTKDGDHLPMVPLYAIIAREKNPPDGCKPICWHLLTNIPVLSFEEAVEKVTWYSYRWNIELFHKVLKSGCKIEDCQLRTAERLKKIILLKSVIAWRVFWLSRMWRLEKESVCEQLLTPLEWKLLYRKVHRSKKAPKAPPNVENTILWIAKLGGHLGRANDSPPGVVSIWRGWVRLMDMVEDYKDIYE